MKILVGFMYCIEQEYQESIRSLENQTYTNHDYFRIENLPNKQAHDALYSCFMDHADQYDLFMKLDADMVLCREDFLERAVGVFQKQPQIDDLQIGVHDFFTDQMIYGLHIYSNRVKWVRNEEKIFVDMMDQRKTRAQDMKVLAPAAWHCPNPSNFQAFHFGIHKAVKVLQIGALSLNENSRKVHTNNIRGIIEQWLMRGDIRLGFAAIGALRGLIDQLDFRFVDFDNPEIHEIFSEYENLSTNEIGLQIDILQRKFVELQSGRNERIASGAGGLK